MRRIVAPLVLLLASPALVGACSDDDEARVAGTTTTTADPMDAVLAVTRARLGIDLDDERMGEIVDELCTAGRTDDHGPFAASLLGLGLASDSELGQAVAAFAEGAHLRCPEARAGVDQAVDAAYYEVLPGVQSAASVDPQTGATMGGTLPPPASP